MRSRSCMTLDLASYDAATEHVGFYRPSKNHVHQARSAVGCSASRMKGELHPTKTGKGGVKGGGGGKKIMNRTPQDSDFPNKFHNLPILPVKSPKLP